MEGLNEDGCFKIKQEMEDSDQSDEIETSYVDVKTEDDNDNFEFVGIKGTINDIPVTKPSVSAEKKQATTQNFERVTVKEEVDFTCTYCEMCNIKFPDNVQFEKHCALHNMRSTYFCSVCLQILKSKKAQRKTSKCM